jgi:hypothetical protein
MSLRVLFVLSVVVGGCAKSGDRAPGGCTGLDGEACLLPWPSSAYLVADSTKRTGFRVSIPAASMPLNDSGERLDPAAWNSWDGFSPMTTLIAEFTSVIDPTLSNLASWHHPGASLAVDSPTVVIDVDSGERIAHFAEIEDSPQVAAGHTTLYVRPAARLKDNHHYAVALRGLRTKDGAPVPPSAGFAALRDGRESPIDAGWYDRDVFGPLAKAGVDRASLLLAWDFRTASGETAWGDVVAMRDDAIAMAGAAGLGCTVSSSVEDPADTVILRRIDGKITVPNFLVGTRIARDAAGRPKIVGTTQASFIAIVPRSAGTKAPIWIYGHGLFSQRDEILRDFARDTASLGKAVIAATDFTGLSSAEESIALNAFLDPSTFPDVVDPVRQSYINMLLLPRTLAGACASLPEFQVGGAAIIDGTQAGYFGNSMGGTLGTSLAALSPDMSRFALGVAGMDLPVQMPRNYAWPRIESLFKIPWPRRIDRDLIVVMSAHDWDHVDSSLGPHVLADRLPGSGSPPQVLMQIGLYDTDVVNVSSELAARTLGLAELSPSSDPVWGMSAATAPQQNALVVYDEGAAPITDGTIPTPENGVHEKVRLDPRAQQQLVSFLLGGGVIDTCNGACTSIP